MGNLLRDVEDSFRENWPGKPSLLFIVTATENNTHCKVL